MLKKENGRNIDEELEFISSHFYHLSSAELEKLKKMDIDVIERILNPETLCLEDEDSLFQFIASLGTEYSALYDFVECQFLSMRAMERFLSLISCEEINCCLWGSICRRLQCKISSRRVWESRFNIGTIAYSEGNESDGILRLLTRQCGGNVHQKGVVDITASSSYSGNCWQVANHEWSSTWQSNNANSSWIRFDFKEREVALSHYTVQGNSVGCLAQWQIEGSDDGSTYSSLDTRDIRGSGSVIGTYECHRPDRFFRYIRLRQTGANQAGNFCMYLSGIEFFGKMKKA
jgi:hypothetical protein